MLTPKDIPASTLPRLPMPQFSAQGQQMGLGPVIQAGVRFPLPAFSQHSDVRVQMRIQTPNAGCRAGLWHQGNHYNDFERTFVTIEHTGRVIFLQIAGGHNGAPIELYLSHSCHQASIVWLRTITVQLLQQQQQAPRFMSHVIPDEDDNDN